MICSVAPATPTTAGMPYSRATTAPCDIIPPISITRAPAVRKRGVQPGSVEGATRISPGSSLAPAGERITRAIPETTPGEAGEPRSPSPTDTSAASASVPSDRSKRSLARRSRLRSVRAIAGSIAARRLEEALLAGNVEVAVLLARERSAGQVLGSGRGPHGDALSVECGVCLASGIRDHVRHR